MRRIILLFWGLGLLSTFSLKAQIIPIPNHFIISPYTYNPSLVGFDQYMEVQLMHKQQWVSIENAPSITNLTFQMPYNRQVNIGGNLMYDQNGLFRNTMAVGTFGYMLPIGYKQNIRFGLSGGFMSQQYDVANSSNPSDPAIANYENQFNPIGNFGVTYQYGTAHIGLALPNLFGTTYLVNTDNPADLTNQYLSQFIISGGMKLEVNEEIKVEPSAIYRFVQNDKSLVEIATLVHYQDFLWGGGSYRIQSGATIMFGAKFNSFRVGYAQELATSIVNGFGGGSHEIFLSYRIGSKRTFEDVVKPPKTPKPPKEKKAKKEKPAKEKKAKKEKPVKEKKAKEEKPAKEKKESKAAQKTSEPTPVQKEQKEEPKVEEIVIDADTLETAKVKPKKQKETKEKKVKAKKTKAKKEPKAKKQPKAKKTKTPTLKNIEPKEETKPIEKGAVENEAAAQQVETTPAQEKPVVVVADQSEAKPDAKQQQATESNFQATKITVEDPSISKGYYVTVGVFAEEENAIGFKEKMKNKGFKDTDFIYSPVTKYNYVYVINTKDLTEARLAWLELRSTPGFEETWVYTVEVK